MTVLSSKATKAAMKQIKELHDTPIDGITILPSDDISEVVADIKGPAGTPYEGGTFRVVLLIGENFPDEAPKGFFRTKIYHPNVSEKGEICVDTLKKDWSSTVGLCHVLTVVRCLMIAPNPESALNEAAGRFLLEDYAEFARRVRMCTAVHATPYSANRDIIGESNTSGLNNQQDSNNAAVMTIKKSADKKRAALKRL
eukprot:Tbor_TRINITY_DN5555_c4_g5::TRINITY_DN5555_c4_g5_i1::g.13299::m.13299/K10583/UBE2S, E2EPF; ubiquitin-conjugating enzyme E2 S